MQQHRLLFSLLVLAIAVMSAVTFLDSPSPTLAQSAGSPTNLIDNGMTMAVITTTTPIPSVTATATGTITATATATATITATSTTTATVTTTPTATGTPASRDTYLALIQLAENSPTPTATPTITPSPTPLPECNAYFDDFSNSGSGWPVGEDSVVRYGYSNGEYSLATRQGGYIIPFQSPSDAYSTYSVEADLRWNGTLGNSYGLVFGIAEVGGDVEFYLVDMNTEFRQYRVVYFPPTGNGQLIVPITSSDAIAGGNAVNHVKVTVNGNTQSIEVNDQPLVSFNTSQPGARFNGIVVSASSAVPQVDARFDNFCVTTPSGAEREASPATTPLLEPIAIPSLLEW